MTENEIAQNSVKDYVLNVALSAKRAASVLRTTSLDTRNAALSAMARALRENASVIIEANNADVQAARKKQTPESLIDRLLLDDARVEAMAASLDCLAAMPDPLNKTLEQKTLYNGLDLRRVSTPLGVVAMIYEARPNVTCDAIGLCIKSGNAVVLRGGSMAANSNRAISSIMAASAETSQIPIESVGYIDTDSRQAVSELMQLHGIVDVLIPRGGAGLIKNCVDNSRVPVIETGSGNCHIYVDERANTQDALNIIHNAKTQRTGVCNAAESVLIHKNIASEFLPKLVRALKSWDVLIHADQQTAACARTAGLLAGDDYYLATDNDWAREYLGLEISVKVIDSTTAAIEHINKYSTHHSEAIITENEEAARAFLAGVDSAVVYKNASTRFTDGEQFGLGAEIGISTQKLHTRGPFALDALCTYKYVVQGTGQVRAGAQAAEASSQAAKHAQAADFAASEQAAKHAQAATPSTSVHAAKHAQAAVPPEPAPDAEIMAPLSKEFFEARKQDVKARVSKRRYKHIKRVVKTAKKLAKIYNVNPKKAKLAALLHDWDKGYDNEGIRARALEVGLDVPQVALADMPQTLHGMTAALALARDFPCIPEDVLHAVSTHTTADINLTPLDMVINIADCIEPGRDVPLINAVRPLVGKVCLEELFFRVYGAWISVVVGRGATLYPTTMDVWNFYAMRHKWRGLEERAKKGLGPREYDPNAVMDGKKARN